MATVWEQLVDVQTILHNQARAPREKCAEASVKLDQALAELRDVVYGAPLTNRLLAAVRRASIGADTAQQRSAVA